MRRLVLVAPAALGGGRRSPLGYALPLASLARRSSPAFLALLAADAARAGALTLWRAARELLAEEALLEELRQVRAPTLLVWGERDPLVPAELADAFAEAIPDARTLLLPGAGHVPMFEDAGPFNRALLEFLE